MTISVRIKGKKKIHSTSRDVENQVNTTENVVEFQKRDLMEAPLIEKAMKNGHLSFDNGNSTKHRTTEYKHGCLS